ncbi:histidine kinase [Ensifer sp. HO-A22]|uniref:histidine kinase n=1 Tax=Ensifer oleiphilus TaxID=2742698 RepID=A0A7Y6Q4W5_9HYPH|nr:ATP-binding protein [Ensifer oleiphilus]NVD38920.1 histidine kinase [Ensifer oleiphilus]
MGSRCRLAVATLLFLVFAPALAVAASPQRILVVYENESTLFAVVEVAAGLREQLEASAPGHIEIYTEYLDIVRFPSADRRKQLSDDLVAKYRDMRLDAVLAVGPGALRFLLERRDRLASGVPIVFGAIRDLSAFQPLPADVKGIVNRFDVSKTLQLSRQLQPQAKKAVVLSGSSAFDRNWQATARAALGDHHAGLDVEYLSGFTLDGFKQAAGALPADAVLLILTVFEDAAGQKFVPRDASVAIAKASSVPVYTVYSSYFGSNVLAGYVGTFEMIGRQMADLALRVLKGDISFPQTIAAKETNMVDWREVQRWRIDRDTIPEGTRILNYEPTAWERYRLPILLASSVIAAQMLTIGALLFQNRRSRRLEEVLSTERLELAHLSRRSQLGELSGALAHELAQPLTSILANAEAGQRLAMEDAFDRNEVKEIFDDIIADDKRAASVMAQLRSMMLKGDASLEVLDLNEAVRTTVTLANAELMARRTEVTVIESPDEARVKANLVQLQQVILNLLLNAADAMETMPSRQRKVEISVRRREDGTRELAVSDRGPGVPPEMRNEVFKPFVSTKKTGLGLGLAICRSIIEAQGGKLFFDDSVVRGARAVIALPAA